MNEETENHLKRCENNVSELVKLVRKLMAERTELDTRIRALRSARLAGVTEHYQYKSLNRSLQAAEYELKQLKASQEAIATLANEERQLKRSYELELNKLRNQVDFMFRNVSTHEFEWDGRNINSRPME